MPRIRLRFEKRMFSKIDVDPSKIRRQVRFAAQIDPGAWEHAPEWWGTQCDGWGRDHGRMVYSSRSEAGNGKVQVTGHRCESQDSNSPKEWFERSPEGQAVDQEWRVLRFNRCTRQSVSKVTKYLARNGESFELCNPTCLAFEYLKTMAAVVATIHHAQHGEDCSPKRLLFIGLGGGSLPAYLSHMWPSCQCEVVELDPVVLDAAYMGMGFPKTSVSGDRLCVYLQDGATFIQERANELGRLPYDFVIIDAFDGNDSIPEQLGGSSIELLEDLDVILHPAHGTLLVNIHGGKIVSTAAEMLQRLFGSEDRGYDPGSTMGQQVVQAAAAYCRQLQHNIAFTVSCARQDNIIFVASRAERLSKKGLACAAVELQESGEFSFDVRKRVLRHFCIVSK